MKARYVTHLSGSLWILSNPKFKGPKVQQTNTSFQHNPTCAKHEFDEISAAALENSQGDHE